MIGINIRIVLPDDDMIALREMAQAEFRDVKAHASYLLARAIRLELARKRKAVK
jgi:hypothetical protein